MHPNFIPMCTSKFSAPVRIDESSHHSIISTYWTSLWRTYSRKYRPRHSSSTTNYKELHPSSITISVLTGHPEHTAADFSIFSDFRANFFNTISSYLLIYHCIPPLAGLYSYRDISWKVLSCDPILTFFTSSRHPVSVSSMHRGSKLHTCTLTRVFNLRVSGVSFSETSRPSSILGLQWVEWISHPHSSFAFIMFTKHLNPLFFWSHSQFLSVYFTLVTSKSTSWLLFRQLGLKFHVLLQPIFLFHPFILHFEEPYSVYHYSRVCNWFKLIMISRRSFVPRK